MGKKINYILILFFIFFINKNLISAPLCLLENNIEEIEKNSENINDNSNKATNNNLEKNNQETNENIEEKDIEISADNKIEVDNENGVMIVSGNAFVKEGQTSLKADILTAFTCETKNGDTKVIQVNADNNVIIISDQGKAFANRGIYFVEEKIIELYEKVKLEKDGDILVGDKGIFNVITGKGEISIDPDNKGKKRKVYGIIRSKNRKK